MEDLSLSFNQHHSLPPWLGRQLHALVKHQGHAKLIEGASGLGQGDLALALAKSWLCEALKENGEACHGCESCHYFEAKTHPDLMVLMPETIMLERAWPLLEAAQLAIDEKKRKPSKEIRVEAMRSAVEFTQRTNARGRCKVLVVFPAENMNIIAANTLLKTLEEPPGNSRFILASEASSRLLPTIRSRCLVQSLAWPSEKESLAWLMGKGFTPEEARDWWLMTGGRVGDIDVFRKVGINSKDWQKVPEAVMAGQALFFKKWPVKFVIDALQKLCHDLLLMQNDAPPRFFYAVNLPAYQDHGGKLSAWGKSLMLESRSKDFPYKEELFIEALLVHAFQVLNAQTKKGNISSKGD